MPLRVFYAAWYLCIFAEAVLLLRVGFSKLRGRYVPLIAALTAFVIGETCGVFIPYHTLLYFEAWRATQIVLVAAQAWLVFDVLRRRKACYKLLGQFGQWTATVSAGLALVAGTASIGAIYHAAAWADPRLGWTLTIKQAVSQTIAIRLAVFGAAYGFVPAEVSPNLRRYQAFLTLLLGSDALLFLILGLSGASDSPRISIVQNLFDTACYLGFAYLLRERDEYVQASQPLTEAEEERLQAAVSGTRDLAGRSLDSVLRKPKAHGPSDR